MKPPREPPHLAHNVALPKLGRVAPLDLFDGRQQMIQWPGDQQVNSQLDHDDDRQHGGADVEPGCVPATRHLGGEPGSVLPYGERPAPRRKQGRPHRRLRLKRVRRR